MIAGQTADIEAESGKNPLTQELLLFIHEKKTAALIEAAFMIGAVLAGASDEETGPHGDGGEEDRCRLSDPG